MLNDHYTYQTRWSSEDGEFVATCLEFPSLSWLADSDIDAYQGIKKLVAEVIEDLRANGEPVPEAQSAYRVDEARVAALGRAIAASLEQSRKSEVVPFKIEEIIAAVKNAVSSPVHL